MKKGKFTALALLGGALIFTTQAEKVQLEDLPNNLQDKIRSHTGSARVEDIDRTTRNGQTTYEVAFKRNGEHVELQLDENGNPLTSGQSSTLDSRKIPYSQVPENVRRVAESRLQGAEVNDVDRQVKNGRTTYEIGFKTSDGAPQQELLIAADGRILRDVAGSQTRVDTTPAREPIVSRSDNVYRSTIEYSELPSTVRKVSDARLHDGDVSQVERLVQAGQIRYEIEFAKEDGRTQELVIAEDGRVLRDEFISRNAVGSPAAVSSGTGSSNVNAAQAPQYSHITSPVRLSSSQEVDVLPVMVRRVVQQRAPGYEIDQIERGVWEGRTVYQVGLRDANNRYSEMQLDENGRVIYDTRGRTATSNFLQPLLDQFRQSLSD